MIWHPGIPHFPAAVKAYYDPNPQDMRVLTQEAVPLRRIAVLSLLAALLLLPGQAAAATDQTYHFGFKKSRGGEPASIDQEGFKPILDKHGAIYIGNTERKELYLTFDNGYENGYTPPILDVLKEKKVPAAFFLTGHYVQSRPDLVKRMVAEGHLVGNHSWSHPDMTQISNERIRQELDKVKEAVAAITPQKEMIFCRPPRGIFNDRVLAASKQYGYTNVFWSIAYADWDTSRQKGMRHAYDSVVSQLHPGAIILLHSVSRDNAEALAAIIDEARRQGYTFQSLEHLLPETPKHKSKEEAHTKTKK